MANIGNVVITKEWANLQDLIRAQIDGQSAFTFDSTKTYSLIVDTGVSVDAMGAYYCETTTKPTEINAGNPIEPCEQVIFEFTDGVPLWVKVRGSGDVARISIDEK